MGIDALRTYRILSIKRSDMMILKSAKAHGEKNDEPPTVVNLKSGW